MDENAGREVAIDTAGINLVARGEIDMQIATAHKYPRSIKRFRDEALAMVTLDESIASECMYVLQRKQRDKATGKYQLVNIEGPSARFAEIVASAWGNCRAGARIVQEAHDFIVAQGVFHDLERNSAIAFETRRPVLTANGERFKADMIGVTGNAASSIALRNAILKGVPKAFWSSIYEASRKCAMGDFKTLANRRASALVEFKNLGIPKERVYAKLGVAGIEDIGLDHLLILRGIITAIRDGDTTPEQAFDDEPEVKAAPPTVPRKPKADDATPPTGPVEADRPELTDQGQEQEREQEQEQAQAQERAAAQQAPQAERRARDDDLSPSEPPPTPGGEVQPGRRMGYDAAADDGVLASDGERAHIRSRAVARKIALPDVLSSMGLALDHATLFGLTKAQFMAIKAQL